MTYTPQKLVSLHREMGEKTNWNLHKDLRRKINNSFVERRDWPGLKNFYEDVLEVSGIEQEYISALRRIDVSKYEEDLSESFKKAISKANELGTVKAIYFEHESGQANFFLCTSYIKDEEFFWASEFDEVIFAPEIELGFDFLMRAC